MTTIAKLAAELNCQPYELAAYLDLGRDYDDNAEISADDEQWMREAIAYGAADAE